MNQCDHLTMGLNVMVGYPFDLDDEVDRRSAIAMCDLVRATLAGAGLPDWPEPVLGRQTDADMGYSDLHYLRRVAAHILLEEGLPQPGDRDSADDPALSAVYNQGPRQAIYHAEEGWETVGVCSGVCFDHLIFHSDTDGYYVPVDFHPVIIDERVTGACLGSSHRLLDECLRLATALGLPSDPDPDELGAAYDGAIDNPVGWQRYGVESLTCWILINAAHDSINTGAPIVFW